MLFIQYNHKLAHATFKPSDILEDWVRVKEEPDQSSFTVPPVSLMYVYISIVQTGATPTSTSPFSCFQKYLQTLELPWFFQLLELPWFFQLLVLPWFFQLLVLR